MEETQLVAEVDRFACVCVCVCGCVCLCAFVYMCVFFTFLLRVSRSYLRKKSTHIYLQK